MSGGGNAPQSPPPEAFVPEFFCDRVYDYIDDGLAEAMDEMETELLKAAAKAGGADKGIGGSSGIEATIKTCCDNVQKRIQQEFDRNIDIFDRYIKKNVAAVAAAGADPFGPGALGTAGMAVRGPVNNGAARPAGGRSAKSGSAAGAASSAPGATATGPSAVGGGSGGGDDGEEVGGSGASPARGGTPWNAGAMAFDAEEATTPKRLEEEEALDAEIQQLRKRRREGLRRCAAMVRKGARENAVLQDMNDYVDALQVGVNSSFDDNGLNPMSSKVQEAVQSWAELRVTADRAQELTRRLEREQAIKIAGEGSGGGRSTSGAVAATMPAPRDLQAMFQKSSEQQVVAGGATELSALETRLRG